MARTRTRTDTPPSYDYYKVDFQVGGTDASYGPYLVAKDIQTMTDTLTPNFRKKVKAGETIINPMSLSRVTRDSIGEGAVDLRGWNASGVTTTQYHGSGAVTGHTSQGLVYKKAPETQSELVRQAQLMAYSGIDSTPLSTGEDVLELRETLQFLKSPIKGIIKEARKRNITRFVDVPAATWLTYRMAFAPTVRSIHDILKEIKEPSKKPAELRVSHGRSNSSKIVFDNPKIANTLGGFHHFSTQHSLDIDVHTFVRYRLKTATHDWRWRYGLRNKDLPAAYWAVMPLSFMVDRVFDVSSLISSLTNLADPNVQILGSGIRIKRLEASMVQHSHSTINSTIHPRLTYGVHGESIIDTAFTMTRDKLAPQFKHFVPVVTPKGLVADFAKSVDLAALVRMFTRKR